MARKPARPAIKKIPVIKYRTVKGKPVSLGKAPRAKYFRVPKRLYKDVV